MSEQTERTLWAHLGDGGIAPEGPPLRNAGVAVLGDGYFDAAAPHPDSLAMAHHMLVFLAEFHAVDDLDIHALADALEEGLWQARTRALAGRTVTLYGLTVVGGVRSAPAEACPGGTIAGLKDEVVSGYASLAALCEALSVRVPEPLCGRLEIRAAQLRAEVTTLMLAFAGSTVDQAPVQPSLRDDLTVVYASLVDLHRMAAQRADTQGNLGTAEMHVVTAQMAGQLWQTCEGLMGPETAPGAGPRGPRPGHPLSMAEEERAERRVRDLVARRRGQAAGGRA